MAPRSVFITGASRGIGLEFVKQFLSSQNPPKLLFAACRDPSKADELRSLAEKHEGLKLVKLDVTKDADIASAFEQTRGVLKEDGLNLLINNAGINSKEDAGFLEHMTRERMQSHFETNVTAPTLITQQFLPLLKKAADANSSKPAGSDRAAVVNISTILASLEESVKSTGNMLQYRASKAALNMAIVCTQAHLQDSGILFTAIHPGWVVTDMGGPGASLKVSESVSHLMNTISHLNQQSTGKLLNYDGKVIPW